MKTSAVARLADFFNHYFLLALSLAFFIVAGVSFVSKWQAGAHWENSGTRKGSDLVQHHAAGRLVREEAFERIYQGNDLLEKMGKPNAPYRFNYIYSPLVARVASVFAGNPYPVFYRGWFWFSLAALLGAVFLLGRCLSGTKFLPVYVLGFPSAAYGLILGQNTPLSLFFLALSGCLLKKERFFLAGAVLSCISYKPTILPFLGLMFLVMGGVWRRALAGLVVGGISWLLLTVFAGGWDVFISWVEVLVRLATGGEQSQNWTINVTWTGFLHTLGWERPGWFLLLSPVPVVLAAGWLRLKRVPPPETLFAAVLICIPFLPYAMSYELLLTVPAFLVLLKDKGGWSAGLLLMWWGVALMSHQPLNWPVAFSAPFLTLIALGFLWRMPKL